MAYQTCITAHSGCEGTARDSRDSLLKALELGADVAEVDVRRAPDGSLIISHDRQRAYPQALSLREAMELIAADGSMGLNCDLKEAETAEDALSMAHELGIPPERLFLSGRLTPAILRAKPWIARQCRVYLNLEEVLGELIGTGAREERVSLWVRIRDEMRELAPHLESISRICREVGAQTLNLPYLPLTKPCFDLAGSIPLSVWTVNEDPLIEEMLRLGVANLTTLRVKRAMELREPWAGK